MVENRLFLVEVAEFTVNVRPLLYQQQLSFALLSLHSGSQSVSRNEHVRPRCSSGSIVFLFEVAMDTDDVDCIAFHCTVREVLNTIHGLRPRDAAANDSNIGIVQAKVEFEVRGDVTYPTFAGWDRPYSAKRLILKIDTLSQSAKESPESGG